MTEAQAIEAISELVVAQWAVVSSNLPIALDNEALPAVDSFAQLTIKHAVSRQMTQGAIGTRRFERRGIIFVKLWGPVDAGRRGLSAFSDGIRAFLGSTSINAGGDPEPITTLDALPQEAGVDGRWFMLVVQVPFRYYSRG